MGSLVNNQCDAQRRHLDKDIDYWTHVYDAALYNAMVQPAFRAVIRRIGTGPWGAGDWRGDAQQYFLAVWLATSLLGANGPSLDYYIYDRFCENAGNQCFVLETERCRDCIDNLKHHHAGGSLDPGHCGHRDIWGVAHQYQGHTAAKLYADLKSVGGPPGQVFDVVR